VRSLLVRNHHNGDRGILKLAAKAALIAPIGAPSWLSIACFGQRWCSRRRPSSPIPSSPPPSGGPSAGLAHDEQCHQPPAQEQHQQGQHGGQG